ncbi:TPA: DUF4760 domain-containing protein [Stenotrophomonas maltophilia]
MAGNFFFGGGMESTCSVFGWEQARNIAVTLGFIIAGLSLRATIVVARRKQSSDLVFAGRNDDKFIAGIRAIRGRDVEYVKGLVARENQTDDAINARYVLNYFEALAVGVRKNIYDEDILYLNYKTTLKHLYASAQPMITGIRGITGVSSLYCQLSWLAERWAKAEHSWLARTCIGWSWSRTLNLLSRGRIPSS